MTSAAAVGNAFPGPIATRPEDIDVGILRAHVPDLLSYLGNQWHCDGMVYQRPEIVLAFKAKLERGKDAADLERTWPLLGEDQRAWLRSTLERLHPGHHWLENMR